jgi:nuclear transport factor 2 (NTF2) superfamily protein
MGKTTEEIRKDEQWAYSCRLARSRGKAMAIILDENYDYCDIDEVLIIVGPAMDIMIKVEYEDDEVSREVFTENYVQHIEGRYGKRDNIMCITVPVEERDKKFIIDSGSGHDLISAKKIDRMDLPTYDDSVVNFHTANGVTCSTKRSDIKFEAFDEPAQAHILEDTPSVMSMGKRCVDLGYSFIWPSGKTPYMIDANGKTSSR